VHTGKQSDTGQANYNASAAELLLAHEVADWLRVGKSTVYAWANAGKLPCIRLNGILRFRPKDIQEWLEAHQVPISQGATCLDGLQSQRPPVSTAILQRTARHVLRHTTDTATVDSEKSPSLGKKQG
jgi:excisionase family DNA binding protein